VNSTEDGEVKSCGAIRPYNLDILTFVQPLHVCVIKHTRLIHPQISDGFAAKKFVNLLPVSGGWENSYNSFSRTASRPWPGWSSRT